MSLIDGVVTPSTVPPFEHRGVIIRTAKKKKDEALAWRKSEEEAGAFMLEPKNKIVLFTWTLLQPASKCIKR